MSLWETNKLNYIHSCYLGAKVQVKIGALEGDREKPNYKDIIANPILKYSGVFEHNDLYITCQLFADSQSLCMPVKTSYKYMETKWLWDEWLTLPLSISDLPRNTLLTITVWDLHIPQEDIPIAGSTISLFDNYGELRQGSYEIRMWKNKMGDGNERTSTPGILCENSESDTNEFPILNELDRLAKLSKLYTEGNMIKQDWLDSLSFNKMNQIITQEKKNSQFFYLKIEFPDIKCDDIKYHVLYFEEDAKKPTHLKPNNDIFVLNDPELELDNIIEKQHIKLEHSKQMGFEMNLKPDTDNKQLLTKILNYPVTRVLKQEEKQLLFKYRYYLSQNKKALTKVLQCFNLAFEFEGTKLMELLTKWQPMDVEDSLELLSSKYKVYPKIRSYAVSRLKSASDDDLVLYLLQLVQALRYDNLSTKQKVTPRSNENDIDQLQNVFDLNLKEFLIERAKSNEVVADFLYWFIKAEVGDNESQRTNFHVFMDELIDALLNGGSLPKRIFDNIVRQESFLKNLNEVVKIVQRESGNRDRKVVKLRQILNEPSKNLLTFDEIPLILDPEVKINGILVEKTTMFKSNLMPCKFVFRTNDDNEYSAIYKIGDDLRQDQLVLQTIALMDKLLKQENLDLKLTPYKVIATGPKEGFISFVDAISVSQILNEYRSIKEFLRKHNPSDTDRHGITAECMDAYVRSSAGYIVITYLLGVGDRHCDNILISKTGRLLHIDFGYILGRDPKVLQPTVKLTKDMADGMGGRMGPDGKENKEYEDFKKYCCNAFLHLRRHANLIINLFSLMVDANIPDIAIEPDKTVKKIMDRFKLDVNDEEAVISLVKEIESSYDSIVGNITDRIHNYNTALK